MAKIFGPNGGRYRGVPLYAYVCACIVYMCVCIIMYVAVVNYESSWACGSNFQFPLRPCCCDCEQSFVLQLLIPGIDNSLSSYMNQRSVDGKIWRRRWFVLTNRTLICYDTHLVSDQKVYCLALYFTFLQHDEAIGAIPLAGYTLSLPTEVHQSFQSGS